MVKYAIKRVLLMIFTLFVIMTMCFVLIKLLPLPAVKEMGKDINIILMKREQMGYGKPIPVQYFPFPHPLFKDRIFSKRRSKTPYFS